MLLLCCNLFCRNIDKGGAQNSWDTHIVHNSKGDVRGQLQRRCKRSDPQGSHQDRQLQQWGASPH